MFSPPKEYPRATAALSGLGLTTQFAAAATDGIPIAKLVLGVVSRIVTLAEDIEKNRHALHELAESARTMGLKISAVVAGRQLSPEMEGSLEDIYEVLRSTEALFKKHKAKHWLRRALSYALTTSKCIEALSQELSRARDEFLLVAAIDTNARMQENSQYAGMFRNLHDCDVDKLELILEHASQWNRYSVKYYTANVEKSGEVFVLRYLDRNARFDSEKHSDDGADFLQEVSEHDRTLKQFSTVRNSHRNIARMYGSSLGDPLTGFTVMKSGYIPILRIEGLAARTERPWDMIDQIVDAVCHLDERGASWMPGPSYDIFIDGSGCPVIGSDNDLRPGRKRYGLPHIIALSGLVIVSLRGQGECSGLDASDHHVHAALSGGMCVPSSGYTSKYSIPWRPHPTSNERTLRFLKEALERCKHHFPMSIDTGAIVLRAAAFGRKMGPKFLTQYRVGGGEEDHICMSRVEETDDKLIQLKLHVYVPSHMKADVRKKLGIAVAWESPYVECFISTRNPTEPSGMSFRSCP